MIVVTSKLMKRVGVAAAGAAVIAAAVVVAQPVPVEQRAVTADVQLVSDTPTKVNKRFGTKIQAALERLNGALSDFQAAMDAQNFPALQDACNRIGSAGRAIEGSLPAPSPDVTTSLRAAAARFNAAGAQCGGLTPEGGKGAIDSVVADVKGGLDNVRAAQSALSAAAPTPTPSE